MFSVKTAPSFSALISPFLSILSGCLILYSSGTSDSSLILTLAGFFFGLQAILTISFGTSMTSASNLSSMSRNFTPLMGTFFGLAFKKYGHPVVAIVIGEMIIQLMFNGFVALGAPTTIQNVVTGAALLLIVALTTKPVKGFVVK